jgi:hypothetical protein
MPLPPLLHAAQAVHTAASINLPALALTVGVVAAVATFGALALAHLLRKARSRRRVALVTGAVLAAMAVAPSVVPYDHLGAFGAHDDHSAVHVSHCHTSPASCSDAPVTFGPGQLIGADPLIVVPAMLSMLILAAVAPLLGVSRRPELRPPVTVAV